MNTSVEIFSPYRTMFHVKPFPKDLPITIATYQDTNKNLPSELSEVNHSVLGIYRKSLSGYCFLLHPFTHPLIPTSHPHTAPQTYILPHSLYTHARTHACTHTRTHARTHTRTHTHTHTHTVYRRGQKDTADCTRTSILKAVSPPSPASTISRSTTIPKLWLPLSSPWWRHGGRNTDWQLRLLNESLVSFFWTT